MPLLPLATLLAAIAAPVISPTSAPTPTPAATPVADECVGDRIRHLGGDVKEPVEVFKPKLQYPAEVRRSGASGVVLLEVVVTKSGSVAGVRVTKSAGQVLDGAAIEHVKQWRFKPATELKVPVCAYLNTVVSFQTSTPASRR